MAEHVSNKAAELTAELTAEQLITENLDIWTSAIEQKSASGRGSSKKFSLHGIKKLRELILELAVRGKLVPQDEKDEPASVLLERIAAEKAQLVKDKKIKKPKALPEISEDEKPFEVPHGWEWSRLGSLSSDIHYGYTASAKQNSEGVRLLRITDIQNDKVNWSTVPACDISPEKAQSYLLENDDILLARTGGTIGKSYLVENININAVFASYLIRVRRIESMYASYIKVYLGSQLYWGQLYDNAAGTGQPNVNATALKSLLFPIAPLEEQHRIVAKVDELMSLCDALEAQTEASLTAHQTLVETLIGALLLPSADANSPELAESPERSVENGSEPSFDNSPEQHFIESWQRVAEHFDTLFTTSASIDTLKQTILQLAVMGKLVEQDANDEPAAKLLERIAAEKEQLIRDKKIKKQKPLPAITDEEKPFELPNGWEWCRLPDLGDLARGKSKHRPRNDPKLYQDGNIPLVQTGDVARSSGIIETYTAQYNEFGLAQSQLWPKGTLCITIAANIADTGILGFDACFPDSVVGYTPFDARLPTKYFDYFIRTAKANLERFAPSTAQKNINLEILSQVLVPCPPTQEFKRIVAKVDELMALCDQLKARLSDAQTTQLHLTDAIVEQAV